MKTKLLEVRDRGTCIVMLCVDMNPENKMQHRGLRACGYSPRAAPNIMITYAGGGKRADNDQYSWGDRTYAIAHQDIIENWESYKDGDVVDVEFILGETKEPKISQRFGAPSP
jgi:hypothetical protein